VEAGANELSLLRVTSRAIYQSIVGCHQRLQHIFQIIFISLTFLLLTFVLNYNGILVIPLLLLIFAFEYYCCELHIFMIDGQLNSK